MLNLAESVAEVRPRSLTLLTTYQCTAACKQCCFESTPQVKGRLSRDALIERISSAKEAFPALTIVVFSGGESFLLKEDLYSAIEHATSLGLKTRIVTNASWGKRADRAAEVAAHLFSAGLSELNISTGSDHAEFVPPASVVNAAAACVSVGIYTLITVEKDSDNFYFNAYAEDNVIRELLAQPDKFGLLTNVWMPFNSNAENRGAQKDLHQLRKGCDQVLDNVVVTPKNEISACCGLTHDRIPEMLLGAAPQSNPAALRDLYFSQLDDFLKIWIRVDGPYSIIEKLLGERSEELLSDVVHQCQACAVLHQNSELRRLLSTEYIKHLPQVLGKFRLITALNKKVSISKETEIETT